LRNTLYILAFIEGLLVMAIELISGRLLTPIYGGSIYVWSSVLGFTMISLFVGYFFGGKLVSNKLHHKYVVPFSILSCAWLLIMPLLSSKILISLLSLGLILGSAVSVFVLIAVPLILLGAISPQIIQILSETKIEAGKAASNVFAISTFGGVLSTFIVGLYMIPTYGIKATTITIAVISFIYPLYLLLSKKTSKGVLISVLIVISSTFLLSFSNYEKIKDGKLVYASDNLMGRLEVKEFNDYVRVLSNNLCFQSIMNIESGKSEMVYPHVISSLASLRTPETRGSVALVGLAGGSIVNELIELGYKEVTAVDIDSRTKYVSEKYFNVKPNSYTFIEDDGRHFFYETKKTFDVIIIDVSSSEQQPYHLYTKEAIALYYSKLNDKGMLIFNLIDYTDLQHAKISERVGDGMLENKFITLMLRDIYSNQVFQADTMEKIAHEYILFGFKGTPDNISNNLNDMNACCKKNEFNIFIKQNLGQIAFQKTTITATPFLDDKPEMELLNFDRYNILRTQYLFN